ncbi:hypothetical protein [Fibrella arboris]
MAKAKRVAQVRVGNGTYLAGNGVNIATHHKRVALRSITHCLSNGTM